MGWLAGQASNLQPPDPKSGVLPVELPATGAHRGAVSTFQSVVAGPIPANRPLPALCRVPFRPSWDLLSRSAASACARRSTARCSSAPAPSGCGASSPVSDRRQHRRNAPHDTSPIARILPLHEPGTSASGQLRLSARRVPERVAPAGHLGYQVQEGRLQVVAC